MLTSFAMLRYAFAAEPVYIPEPSQRGTAAGFLAVLDAHGLTHGLGCGTALRPR